MAARPIVHANERITTTIKQGDPHRGGGAIGGRQPAAAAARPAAGGGCAGKREVRQVGQFCCRSSQDLQQAQRLFRNPKSLRNGWAFVHYHEHEIAQVPCG